VGDFLKTEKFNIEGMTCSSCVAHVEKAVNTLNGIKSVNVNLLSNNMIVEFDENKIDNKKIIDVVIKAGYNAELFNKEKNELKKADNLNEPFNNINSMKKRLIISIIFLIPLMYIAMGHMLHAWFGFPFPKLLHDNKNAIISAFTQFLLLIPIVYVNRNYFIVGIKRLFLRTPNMDSLIAIGSGATILYGIIIIYILGYALGNNIFDVMDKYSKDVYFESAGTILTLITVGKYLEAKSKGKTNDAISKLIKLAPKTATVIREGKEIELNVDEIIVGDIVAIKPGGSVPVDGTVIEGFSSIDQSAITGESIPVEKNINDNVISGTVNKNGYLKIKATKIGENTTLSQIIKLVEEAGNSKAPIAKIADKVSGIFVPIVIVIAIISTVVWLLLGEGFDFALTMGISVLVISCPCALGLATPVAIMVGTGKGAENGILIKSAESLELLHLVDTVILDKTGTITEGKPKVKEIIGEKDLLKIAASLEKNSEHPLAQAVIEKAKEDKLELFKVSDFISVSGRGVKGEINNINYFGGNIAFMKENNIDISPFINESKKLLEEGKTLLYFAKETLLIGIIAVSDTIKITSSSAISELKKRNIKTIMLTGDNKAAAGYIGKIVGVDEIIAEVLPQDKESVVESQQKLGKKVAFVGDGINDSPALVKADVGVAIGSGTDIAIEAADIVLMKDTLLDVVTAINLSKAVIRNIKMNLFWAFFYNAIGIPIAAGLFYYSLNLRLSPMIGAAAMSLSSVCVVTNALRLRKFKSGFNIKNEETIVKTIEVNGMQCNHCKMTVEKVLGSIKEVIKVEVSLEEKIAKIEMTKEIENDIIKKVIEEEGFTVGQIN